MGFVFWRLWVSFARGKMAHQKSREDEHCVSEMSKSFARYLSKTCCG